MVIDAYTEIIELRCLYNLAFHDFYISRNSVPNQRIGQNAEVLLYCLGAHMAIIGNVFIIYDISVTYSRDFHKTLKRV